MKHVVFFLSIVLFAAVIISGCSKDDNPTTAPTTVVKSTTYIGTLANAAETGSMTLIFSTAIGKQIPDRVASAESTVSVSGSIKVNGVTILLTGTYNS